ncbi:MAG: hypothetical protein WA748_15920 [Candidatus Acidiferrum sp.]
MSCAQNLQHKWHSFMYCVASIAAIFLIISPCRAQSKPATQQTELPWAQDLNKYPGLLPELGRLAEKLQQNVQYPTPRAESRLLPLLPSSTMSYAAFPNYGDVIHQALVVFRQELPESSVLRDWWQHGELATTGPTLLDSLDKLEQLEQYLGEEFVVSGAMDGKEPRLLLVASTKKPGLKKFLQEQLIQAAKGSTPDIRVLDPQELAATKDKGPSHVLEVLVRPDFVVVSSDLPTLRSFSARMDRGSREFATTPFGQRVVKEYAGGVTILAAADLQEILHQIPPSAQQNPAFQNSGFADMKYLVWDHKTVAGQSVSQSELSFNAPRHGTAAWLAKPGPLTSLDFVSSKATFASTVVLANPGQIFDDLKALSTASNSNSFATLAAFEKMLNLSLKNDLLSYLTGEFTLELDSVTPQPVWKAILKVNNATHLQQTLATLLAAGQFHTQQSVDGGITYYAVRVPSGKTSLEISYAFVDGHLVVGSSHDVVSDAVLLHRSGGSLAKDQKFLASLPPGRSSEASALIYEDPAAMTALSMRQIAPQIAETLAQFSKGATPAVICVYGEDSSIREASRSGAFDVGGALIVGAIAIPNLLRSRIAANEASAVGSMRTVNTAEVTYSGLYPQRGFAPDLATLGLDPHGPVPGSPEHAGLIDETLAKPSCTAGAWCTKSGYRFAVKSICLQHQCVNYVVVATPIDTNAGIRSFCSTSDGVIRYKPNTELTSPVSASECKAWTPLK